jgi:hypothetical protein
MKAKPKKHFMTYCGEYDLARGYERVSTCGQVSDYMKTGPLPGRELVTVSCGNCIRLLKGNPPAFAGKMVMLIESNPNPKSKEQNERKT